MIFEESKQRMQMEWHLPVVKKKRKLKKRNGKSKGKKILEECERWKRR